MTNQHSIINELSEFVLTAQYDRLPPAVQQQAVLILLDTLGALLAATAPHYSTGKILTEYILSQGGTPESILIGRKERTSCVNAAFRNGTLGYACDIESHHPAAIMHAAAIVVPSALAIAERQHSSGAELLTAIVLGVELACRVSNAIGPTTLYNRGQHPTCVAGGFGAATAAGYLLKLDSIGLQRAWGLTGTQASGLLAWETDPTENSRPFNPGIAARNGVTAAVLASFGFGGPADIFEGKFNLLGAFTALPQSSALICGLGDRFAIKELAIKRYACCAFLHPGLDGLDEILTEQQLQADQIQTIRLRFPKSGVSLINNNPLRSHCGQYILPIFALERKIIIDDILVDRRHEPAIAALSQKVDVIGDDELDSEFPAHYTSIIEVESDHHIFSRKIRYAKGCPENPLNSTELEMKFHALAGSVLPNDKVESMIKLVRSFDTESSIDLLVSALQF